LSFGNRLLLILSGSLSSSGRSWHRIVKGRGCIILVAGSNGMILFEVDSLARRHGIVGQVMNRSLATQNTLSKQSHIVFQRFDFLVDQKTKLMLDLIPVDIEIFFVTVQLIHDRV